MWLKTLATSLKPQFEVHFFSEVARLRATFIQKRVDTIFVSIEDERLLETTNNLVSDAEMRQVRFVVFYSRPLSPQIHFKLVQLGVRELIGTNISLEQARGFVHRTLDGKLSGHKGKPYLGVD